MPFNSVVFWGGVGTRRPRAKPPCVVSHILCPHLKASPSQARSFFMHNPKISKIIPFNLLLHFHFSHFLSLHQHPHRHYWCFRVRTCWIRGAEVHLAPSVLYGRNLEGDPILFPLPLTLAGWLALMQRGARMLARARPGLRSWWIASEMRGGKLVRSIISKQGRHTLSPCACVMGEIGETALTT